MYPIRIFGIRVPPDGHFEYALYDDTAHYDERDPVTCLASIDDLAAYVARMLFELDRDTVFLCVRQPRHLSNLIAFSAKSLLRGIETRLLTGDERVAFLQGLHTELCSLDARKDE
jgi:hypothetical protein